MTTIYFIRHGKTQWNLASRYQGAHGDSPLLAQSHQDIQLLADSLVGIRFDHAYTSPLKRAKVTAEELIEKSGQPVELTVDDRLIEFNLGKMEGRSFKEVKQRWPETVNNFHYHPDRFDPAVVESEAFEEVIFRLREAVLDYCHRYPTGNVLVVSHGAALNAGINGILGVPLAELKKRGGLSNTSTTVIETTDQVHFNLVKWNDTSYLHRSKADPTDTV
ncbi:MAG: histidine phosphatase family protein [Limosilactobacillus gorillae]|nr:histidine phosphatase family protein [Limosilactobacillus gorillae]